MKKTLIFVSIILFSIVSFAQQHIISFEVMNKSEISKLPHYLSIDNVSGNVVTAYLTEDNLQNFAKLGYSFREVDHPAKGKVLNMATTTAQMANWDRYPTYEVYVQMMNDFVTNYPDLCQLVSIGTTVEGRQLLVLKISDNVANHEAEPEYFYTSTMHGDETTGFVLMLRLIDYLLSNYGTDPDATHIVDNFELYINPDANPDGTYHGGNSSVSGAQRYNANNEDLNRDFPYPLGANAPYQPETQDMMDFASAHNFVMSANFHGGAEVMNYPWDCWNSAQNTHADDIWFYHVCSDYVQSARIYNSSYMTSVVPSGVTEGADWYYADGSRQDYMTYFQNCREVTIELSNTKLLSTDELPTFWTMNKQSLIDFIIAAEYGINGTVKNVNGDPLPAKIEIVGHDQDNSEVYTDPVNGDYYRPIAPGTYNVTYSSEGYISQTHSITVSDYGVTQINNVILLQAAQVTLTGTVIDAITSLPLQGVMISFLNTTISDVETDVNGHYSITIAENEYSIQASKFGYSSSVVTQTITAYNNVVDFALLTSDAIDFETEIPTEITFSGNADWFRTTDQAYEGAYSIKSGDISDNQTSVMTLTATTSAGTISFYKKVSSEGGWDKLLFSIDGTQMNEWSGEVSWSLESFVITEGSHTFAWSYEKDGSVSEGDDCAWVDYIELPSEQPASFDVTFNVSSSGTPIQDASISLTGYGLGNTNTNGEYIFNNVYQATDSIAYTVSATGYYAVSGKVFVDANITENVNLSVNASVNTIFDNIELYPNPTKGIINLNLPVQNGVIQLLSVTGKIIKTINVNSKNQILNLSDQPEGIYLVKFYSDNNIYIEKIVLQK
ncbi:MAG: carboxypeptidase regulatory-like domain-containing protein [Bacteroidales bacterium]|nr:carboxypeptidase regulatory-like domain-containing protein [Bacteroidales bacterium]